MKRTARPIRPALSIERNVPADHLNDIVFLFEFLHIARIKTLATAHEWIPPKEKVEGINRLSNTLIAYLSVIPDK